MILDVWPSATLQYQGACRATGHKHLNAPVPANLYKQIQRQAPMKTGMPRSSNPTPPPKIARVVCPP